MSTIPQHMDKYMDKYELIEHLGYGSTADVWKALDTQLRRFVAIKTLRLNLRDDPTTLVQFQQEARLTASLRCSNIVQIYDFQVWQPYNSDMHPIPYIVMDCIEGPTLANYISSTSGKDKHLSPAEIANLFASISLAIDYVHRQGMIHRDIKPADILLDQRNTTRNPMGEPVLTDFGIAKLLNTSPTTRTGIQLGTPAYVSPEQIRGFQANERSDIYSLAVILYEVVTGIVPFAGDSSIDVMTQHSNATPIVPSRVNPNVPSALDQVIMRGLEKNPAYRFPSAAAMIAAVAHALNVAVPEILGQTHAIPAEHTITQKRDLDHEKKQFAVSSSVNSAQVASFTTKFSSINPITSTPQLAMYSAEGLQSEVILPDQSASLEIYRKLQMLPIKDQKEILIKAMRSLIAQDKTEVLQETGIRSLAQEATDFIWKVVVSSTVIVLVGSAIGIVIATFVGAKVAFLITTFTAVVAFLGGLLTPSPIQNAARSLSSDFKSPSNIPSQSSIGTDAVTPLSSLHREERN